MTSIDAQILLDTIDHTISDFNSFVNASNLEKSYFAKYLVVYISGIYEEVIETIINETVVKSTQSNELRSYVRKTLKYKFQNPSLDNIKKLIKDFENPLWNSAVCSIPKQQSDAIDSINRNKNAIAHGSAVTITLSDVVKYYQDSRPIILLIDSLLL